MDSEGNRQRDRETDALFHAARETFVRRADAAFDFDAGLADVLARAAPERPSLATVCAQADRLASVLGLLPPGGADLAHDHLQRARRLLFDVRALLTRSGRPRPEAVAELLDKVAVHLGEAERQVRSRGPLSLAETLRTQLDGLRPLDLDPHHELTTLRALCQAAFRGGPADPVRRRPPAAGDRSAREHRDD